MGKCSTFATNCDTSFALSCLLMAIAFMLVFFILGKTISAFYCGSKHERPLLYYQISSILSYSLGLGCIFFDLDHNLQAWLTPLPLRSANFRYIRMWANIFAFNSYIATDAVIFGRLYFSFKDSYYKLSKCTLMIFMLVLLLIIALDVAFIIDGDFVNLKIPYICREDILLSFTIIELIFAASISLMFTKKLHQLLSTSDSDQLLSLKKSVAIDKRNMYKFQFNDIQKRLLNLSTKNAIITGVAAIYFALRFGYRQFAVRYDPDRNLESIWMISYTSRTYIFVTNGIAVHFGFAFTSRIYYKLCRTCHVCVFRLCAKIARRNITKHAIEQITKDEYMLKVKKTSEHNDIVQDVYIDPGSSNCSFPMGRNTSINTTAEEITPSLHDNNITPPLHNNNC